MIPNFLLQGVTLATEQTALLHILLSVFSVIVFTTIAVWVSVWLRPHKPNAEKLTTYESGMEPMGNAWGSVNSRLYGLGLIFILFELETILLFPWASGWVEARRLQITSDSWSLYMAISGTFFILVLSIGLVYAVVKGRLAIGGVRANSRQVGGPDSKIPLSYYEQINAKYANPHQIIENQIN